MSSSEAVVLCVGDLHIPDRAIEIPPKFRAIFERGQHTDLPASVFDKTSPPECFHTICLGNVTDPDAYEFLRDTVPGKLHIMPDTHDFRQAIVDPTGSSTRDLLVPKGGPAAAAGKPASSTLPPPTSSSKSLGQAGLSRIIEVKGVRIGFVNSSTVIPPGDIDSLKLAARQMNVHVLLWSCGSHKFQVQTVDRTAFINPGSLTGAFSTASWADGEEPVPSFVFLKIRQGSIVVHVYAITPGPDGDGQLKGFSAQVPAPVDHESEPSS